MQSDTPAVPQRWYRVPVVWLSAAIFATLLAGCIAVIVMADLYADEVLPVSGERVLKVPTHGQFDQRTRN